jgi:Flp pilus assembly protein TadD
MSAMARLCQIEGEFERAEGLYRQAIEVAESNLVLWGAYNDLAYLQATHTGELDEALKNATKAADLNPRYYAVADTLGWVFFLKGNLPEATRHLEAAKAGAPSNPTIRYHLGAVYRQAGDLDRARTEFEQALAISSDFPERDEAEKALQELGRAPSSS